jgi:hypothetical protein
MADPKAHNPLSALDTDQEYEKAERDVPAEIKKWVESAFESWQNKPNSWRHITFASVEDMDSILEDARHYTNVLRDIPLTVQTQGKPEKVANGVRVIYRVRTKVHSGRKARGTQATTQE